MKIKRSLRIPIGFAAGFLFLWRARPSVESFAIGAALIFFGEAIRFISHGTLRKNKGVVSKNGIYAYTRNPLYIGSFFIGTGACVMGRDPLFAALFVVLFAFVYSRVMLREEWFLAKKFGDEYTSYRDSVPRIFPRRFNPGVVLREASVYWALRNREGKTLLGIAAMLAAMVTKMMFGTAD